MKWQTVETKKGTRCRVLEAGSGAPLVFFHGAGGLLRDNPFLDQLAQSHHVVAPEWPGYGESTGEELLEDMLDFTLHGWDLVEALGLQQPHLVGHSMGGMTVMSLAESHPEMFGDRVVGVGLVATTAGGLRTHRVINPYLPDRLMRQVTPRAMALLARAPGLVDGARRTGSDIGFLVTSKMAFGGDVPTPYVEFVDEMLSQTPFEVLAEFFPNFDDLDKFEVLHSFEQVPTLILAGTEDVLTSIGHSRKMASRIRGSQLVEVPGAGHMVILERAEQVNTALARLLAETGGAS